MADPRFPFPDREGSRGILLRDPCFEKIPPEQVDSVFDRAWATGEEAARSFLDANDRLQGVTMPQLLRDSGFQVEEQDIDYIMGKTRYFCEYFSRKNIVCIYKKSVALWAEQNRVCYAEALDMILAHEYFHYLEWHRIGRTSKQCTVPMLRLGPLHLGKTGVAALSEIGANAFAYTCREAIAANYSLSD